MTKRILRDLASTSSLFFLLFSTIPFAIHAAEDWPQWRGPNQDGKATESGVFRFEEGNGLKIAWKKPLGSGYSSISVAAGRAVTMFSDSTFDYVIAFDASSGAELWRHKIDSTHIGHGGSHNGPLSTPSIDGNRVFALGPKGHLLAVDLTTGSLIWSTDIVKDHGAIPPYFAFATAPRVYGEVLILETGGSEKVITGFNKETGAVLWSEGSDRIAYQSPVTANLAGADQVLCSGNDYLIGMNPLSGDKLWEFHHQGRGSNATPIIVGQNRVFLHHNSSEGVLLQINKAYDQYTVNEIWRSRAFKLTYGTGVLHDGHLYGYSRRFLTCVDIGTGKLVWKSRSPGDGFVILVDGHLVLQTKKGGLHIAEASPKGYQEVARLKVFDSLAWTPASFANGKIYARNLKEIACVKIDKVDQPVVVAADPPTESSFTDSNFSKFIQRVKSAEDKTVLVDEFMEAQKQFPIIEGDNLVHFVYRGESQNLVIEET